MIFALSWLGCSETFQSGSSVWTAHSAYPREPTFWSPLYNISPHNITDNLVNWPRQSFALVEHNLITDIKTIYCIGRNKTLVKIDWLDLVLIYLTHTHIKSTVSAPYSLVKSRWAQTMADLWLVEPMPAPGRPLAEQGDTTLWLAGETLLGRWLAGRRRQVKAGKRLAAPSFPCQSGGIRGSDSS